MMPEGYLVAARGLRGVMQRPSAHTGAKGAGVTLFPYIKNHLGKITKSEIMAKCPDISQITVQRALADLLKSGEIIKLSGGRYTSYTWNRERE